MLGLFSADFATAALAVLPVSLAAGFVGLVLAMLLVGLGGDLDMAAAQDDLLEFFVMLGAMTRKRCFAAAVASHTRAGNVIPPGESYPRVRVRKAKGERVPRLS